MGSTRLTRATLFVLVGTGFLAYWVLAGPDRDTIYTEWKYVLPFSAALAALGVALAVLGRLVGGRWVTRLSLVAGGGSALASVVNVVEDGFGQSWAFWGFVLSLATILLALLGLTVAIVATGGGQYRLLALVPAGTVVGIVGFVEVGGVVMLTTWSMAAALALLLPTRDGALTGGRM